MSDGDKTSGMKSAYELALERLEQQGIEPPREDSLDPQLRRDIAEIRQRTEARLAELEILFRDRLESTPDPEARVQAESEYAAERQRLRAERDREIDMLRAGN